MTSSNYRDPATLEEAMREIRHLRKVDKKFDELRTELAALALDLHTETAAVIALRAELEKIKSPGAQPVPDYDALEREHLGDAVKGTGIYAQPVPESWRPIDTCPLDGFFLVYEDEAVRTMFRCKGAWSSPAYAAIVSEYGDRIVGDDAKRLTGGRPLVVCDLCMNPTHWMPLPEAMLQAAKDKP